MTERTNPEIRKNGVAVGRSYAIDFIEGANVTLTISAAAPANVASVTVASAGGGGSAPVVQEDDVTVVATASTFDFGTGFDVTEAPANEANIAIDLTELTVLTGLAFAGNVA